jgi:hypothetical protein
MLRVSLVLALVAAPAIASAQSGTAPAPAASPPAASAPIESNVEQQAQTGQPPKRIRNVQLTGAGTCPKPTGDEIVVCSRIEEPYRIPKALRNDKPIAAQNQSWVNRAATVDQVGRVAGGLPDTCSPVGTGGQSGCALQMNRAYAAEKRQAARDAQSVP